SLLKEASDGGGRLFEVSGPVYEKIAFGNRSEGVIAVAVRPRASLKDIPIRENPLFVVIEGIEKPGNLGAIIRTAQAAGADAVLVADARTDIYNPYVVRSSIGALFEARVVQAESGEIISWLKEREVRIACACVKGDMAYTSVDFRGRLAIAVGSEEKGLTGLWKESADSRVTIPMAGKVDSLNVSCAAAILLFEAVRQRGDIARR
ncbi:RNA methyltransferase, partial [bacterium]